MLLSSLPAPKRAAAAAGDAGGAGASTAAAPTNARDAGAAAGPSSSAAAAAASASPPPYGRRRGFVPRRLEDFGDGGKEGCEKEGERERNSEKTTEKQISTAIGKMKSASSLRLCCRRASAFFLRARAREWSLRFSPCREMEKIRNNSARTVAQAR